MLGPLAVAPLRKIVVPLFTQNFASDAGIYKTWNSDPELVSAGLNQPWLERDVLQQLSEPVEQLGEY